MLSIPPLNGYCDVQFYSSSSLNLRNRKSIESRAVTKMCVCGCVCMSVCACVHMCNRTKQIKRNTESLYGFIPSGVVHFCLFSLFVVLSFSIKY